MTEKKMTEIAALTAAIACDALPEDVRAKFAAMVKTREEAKAKAAGKPRAKSSEDIRKDNHAREVAEAICATGSPVTVKWLIENIDGWSVGTDGKVSSNGVTGILNRAIRMGLIKRLEGTKPAAYASVDYVAPVILN